MENTSTNVKTVEIIADKIYFLEESVNIFVKSDKEVEILIYHYLSLLM